MANYNADILQKFADDLYAKAASITVKSAFLGGLIGALLVAPLYEIDSVRSSVSHQSFNSDDCFDDLGSQFEKLKKNVHEGI